MPVLRDVQHMSFADIEGAINHYGKKAASGSLALEDMAGGTATPAVRQFLVEAYVRGASRTQESVPIARQRRASSPS